MVFGGGILGGARKKWGNPYLNSTTVLFDLIKSPAVPGASGYQQLCIAARNEERRQNDLIKMQQYQQGDQRTSRTEKTLKPCDSKDRLNNPAGSDRGSTTQKHQVKCWNCKKVGHHICTLAV